MLKQTKTVLIVTGLAVIAFVVMVVSPMVGMVFISPQDLIHDENLRFIFFSIRMPRVLVALIAGGGLAVSGMICQGIFRNSLADPYTLGVSSGASLGAALCILAGIGGSVFGLSIVALGAFVGALCSITIIYGFAWSRESNSSTILLAGVVIATVCSGMIMFVHFVGGLHKSFQIVRWIMGGVDGVNYSLLFLMCIPLLIFFIIGWIYMPQLDQLVTGDSIAHSRGVNVRLSRNIFIAIVVLAVGGIVAICGPIGFIGIIAPHACRMLIPGIRHRLLAFCAFLSGGVFLVLADTLARSIVPPSEVPVGIITALLGGPFFLIVLFKNKKRLLL